MRFSKGEEVEVRWDDEGFQGFWYEAKVTRALHKTRRYSVVYDHLFSDGGSSTGEDPHPLPMKEIVECKRVRPRPPRRDGPFALHQPVDAWHKEGWCAGVVLERGDRGEHYTVCFPGRREQVEFAAGDLRIHLEWVNNEWLHPNENVMDMSQCSEGKGRCRDHLKQAEVLNNETTLDGDSLGDHGYNIQLADREDGEPSHRGRLLLQGVVAVEPYPLPEASAALELLDSTKSTDARSNESSADDMQIVEAVTEKQNEDPITAVISCEPLNVVDEETGVTPDVGPSSSASKLSSPFVKRSGLWDVIEATEVFRAMPQQPHFCPTLVHSSGLREGMAIGLMVTFDSLVASITKLQITDPVNVFEEWLKVASLLEANGFDVRRVQDRLEKLLRIKHDRAQLEGKKSALSDQIFKKQDDARVLGNEIEMMDRSVEEIHNRRSVLAIQRESNEREIARLQIDEKTVTEASISAEGEFDSTLAEPW